MSEALRAPSDAEARELIERIIASSGFQRSPRLRELLKFIAESSLQHPSSALTEQQIGVSIFLRPPHYDSSSDTIVRVQISQLRKRLEHYFLTEGQAEPIFVEIPRGSYNAVFQVRDRAPLASSQPDVMNAEPPPAPAPPPGNRLTLALCTTVAILALVCVWLTIRLKQVEGSGQTPAVHRLWSNLIRPAQRTNIVVADSGFGFLQDALGTPMDLDKYLQHDPEKWVQGAHPDPNLSKVLEMLAFRQYTSIGDLNLVRRILSVSGALQSQISTVFARNYNARGSASDNVILLGSQRSNPWAQLYLDRLNFLFDYDEAGRKAIVRNRTPRPGESATYTISGEGPGIKEGYAVIAYLPNQARGANVLMLAGTDMESTEAAGTLTTTEGDLAPVLAKISTAEHLPFFEALFKTRRLAGAPQECQLVSWRPIGNGTGSP